MSAAASTDNDLQWEVLTIKRLASLAICRRARKT
jgi:hypothetical protein